MSDIVLTVTAPSAPTARGRRHPAAWWGMVMLIVTESMIFAGLISSDLFVRAASKHWPQAGIAPPELRTVSIFTVVLLGSSLPVWWGERGIERGDLRRLRIGLAIGFVMGAVFLGYTMWEFATSDFGWTDNAYASLHDTIVGLHAIHVAIGLAMSIGVQAKAWTGRIDARRHLTVRMFGMYWHFVDAVWVVVFSTLFLSVRR
jgi:heme/copper-type cytochrome/quinol oxidase subunit 3